MPDRDINHLQPQFRGKVELWLEKLKTLGIEIKISETLRSFARSAELYAQGRSTPGKIVTKAKPGQSYHNFGLALDCYPVKDGKVIVDFDRHPDLMQKMKHAAAAALDVGIVWGGHWTRFKDLPHFQCGDSPSLAECRRRWPNGWIPEEHETDN